MEQSDVFVSYRRTDVDFVKKVCQALKDTGREVWVDWEDIPPGVEGFGDEIQRGIEGANAFIAILSPSYLESEYCLMELREALKLKKRIVPIVFKKFEPAPPPEGIGHINWVYFTPHAGQENTFEESFPKVIQSLEADYEYSREHTRLLTRAIDWDKNQRNHSYLLKGAEIEKAEQWQVQSASKDPSPTEMHAEYILVSRKQQRRQQQQFTAIVAVLLVLSLIAAVFAVFQANAARISQQIAHSAALAAAAIQPGNEDIAVSLALEAARGKNASPEAFIALKQVAYPAGRVRYLHRPAEGETYEPYFFPAVSPDGKFVVLKDKLYDLSTDTFIRQFEDTPGITLGGIFLSDGKRVILFGDDEKVNDPTASPVFLGMYDVDTGKLIQKYDTGIGISNIQLSADEKTLVAFQPDGKIYWWDVKNGKKGKEFDQGNTTTFSPDLKWVADLGAPADGTPGLLLTIANAKTMDVKTSVQIPTLAYSGYLAFSSDSKVIAVAMGGQLESYDVESGESLLAYDDAPSDITSFHFGPSNATIIATTLNRDIILWDRLSGSIITTQSVHNNNLISAGYTHGGDRIVSMDQSGLVVEWDLLPGNVEKRIVTSDILDAMTPDGQFLVTETYTDTDTVLHIRDTKTFDEISKLTIPGNPYKGQKDGGYTSHIESFYLKDGWENGLAVYITYEVGADGQALSSKTNVISLKNGETLQSWDMYGSAEISPNGQELIVLSDYQKFQVWNIQTGKMLREFSIPMNGLTVFTANPFALSADGTKLLYSYQPGDPTNGNTSSPVTVLMDTISGKLLFTNNDQVSAFTPDGSQFITAQSKSFGGGELTLTIWDTGSGKSVRQINILAPLMSTFIFSPNGQSLFTASPMGGGGGGGDSTPSGIFYGSGFVQSGSLKQWDFATGDLIWEYPARTQNIIIPPDGTYFISSTDEILYWRFDTAPQLIAWACSNRYVPEFTPEEVDQYRIENASSICKSQ
jgi:WD40 repeat protein